MTNGTRARAGGYSVLMKDSAVDLSSPIHRGRQETGTLLSNQELEYPWRDSLWMEARGARQDARCPMSFYEVDLGSWMRVPEADHRRLTYRELAPRLADYVQRHGFTHVQLATPFPSLFSPDPGAGAPQDFMFLIDILHQEGIGVVLSWDPSLASGAQTLQGFGSEAPEENPSSAPGLDYGSPKTRNLLLSSATFWLEQYHIDGLFVDLDLLKEGRRAGADNETDFLRFLQEFNETIAREFPDVQTWAKDSTHGFAVSQPVNRGGLGFGFRWDVEWNRDSLGYLSHDPIFRKHHHDQFHRWTPPTPVEKVDRILLALSHHDVQRPHGSLLQRMPGDDWQRMANLRLLLAYQWALPGKKLLFMGTEFGQWNEWNSERSLDWHLVHPGSRHNGLQKLIGHLNWLYRHEPALQRDDPGRDSFEWVASDDSEQSILAFLRKGDGSPEDLILALFNFTPVPRHNLRFGVPRGGYWREILNTDAGDYGGSGQGNLGGTESAPFGWHSRTHSLHVTLPPLGAVFLRQTPADPGPKKAGGDL